MTVSPPLLLMKINFVEWIFIIMFNVIARMHQIDKHASNCSSKVAWMQFDDYALLLMFFLVLLLQGTPAKRELFMPFLWSGLPKVFWTSLHPNPQHQQKSPCLVYQVLNLIGSQENMALWLWYQILTLLSYLASGLGSLKWLVSCKTCDLGVQKVEPWAELFKAALVLMLG